MYLLKYHQYTILSKISKVRKQNDRSAVDLAYKVYGPSVTEANEHIILLHGLLGSKANWHLISQRIASATNACVIATDARNHGDSPHTDTHTNLDMCSDVLQLITKLNIKKAHVIGHSMGGRTAMAMALTEPSKIASLVVVDISPVSSKALKTTFFKELFKVLESVTFDGADSLFRARFNAKETIMAAGLIKRPDDIIDNIVKLKDDTYGWKYNLNVLSREFPNIVEFPSEIANKQYIGPALFVVGARSIYVPKEDVPGIKRIFPNAELKIIDNVGHSLHEENPKAFFNVLQTFMAKIL